MFGTMAEKLTNELRTHNPQEVHQLFTEMGTQDQMRIWWKWGKDSSESDARWLARQANRAGLSAAGLMMALSAIWGREGETMLRVRTRIAIILEEMGCVTPYLRLLTREEELSEPARVRTAAEETTAPLQPGAVPTAATPARGRAVQQ